MDEREFERGEGRPPTSGAAGPANTPPFGDQPGGSEGRDHAEGEVRGGARGGEGGEGAEEGMQAIAAARHPPAGAASRAGARGPGGEAGEDVQHRARERASEMRDELESRADDALSRAAEGLDAAAQRLDDFAERRQGQDGTPDRVGRMAHGTADTLESAARYLRDNDVEGLKHDLERQVRSNPLQTLLIAVAAGWVVGKILR